MENTEAPKAHRCSYCDHLVTGWTVEEGHSPTCETIIGFQPDED